ncbi:hypothetical protein [Chitinivibrio alkaliphilus]|uniref:Uncharacterized protein n=1 Tax=Chitinivibrio alkaliphilus ACht1 TaxID=1313304 RepID=U7D7C4_9BACT|nr:hypothetical protein [Chitinivibrio alkaliphilus]ERP31002.1 hypothetical protein CALK_2139 [Chitinivibrio alkaliphilus ACht1]
MKIVPLFSLFLLLYTVPLFSHAVISEQMETASTVSIRFSYEDGEPMAYAAVEIFSPAEDRVPFQTGRTDKNGVFSFVPDAEGMWLVSADDGDDHVSSPSFIVEKEGNRFITKPQELL